MAKAAKVRGVGAILVIALGEYKIRPYVTIP